MRNPNKLLTILAASCFALCSNVALAKKGVTTPDGFESVMVLMGTGTIDAHNPEPRPGVIGCQGLLCDGDFFQKVIMGRTDEQIAQVQDEAKAFFWERFGLNVEDLVANNRATFGSFTLNPDFQYRLHIATGMKAQDEGWIVRDGGFSLSITDPQGVTLGGEFSGRVARQGEMLLYGNYNILVTNKRGKPKREIVIDYRSRVPAIADDDGFRLQSLLSNEEFGEGLVLATILLDDKTEGEIKVNARTVISFPAETLLNEYPAFPEFDAKPRVKP